MKWLASIPLIALAAGLYWLGVAHGQTTATFSGTHEVGRRSDVFEMPGGFTAGGKLGAARRFSDRRESRFVPRHYGALVAVTQDEEFAVLWYRDAEGVVRNVQLPRPGRRLFVLETQESTVRQVNR